MRGRFTVCLGVLLALAGACGGRFVKSGTDEGTGGTSNRGGTGSGAGASAVGVAGSVSTGGAPCACDPIVCTLVGFQLVPNTNGCCYQCQCNPKLCPAIACGSGSHLEVQPGQCCQTCIMDDCAQQRAGYQQLKQALVEKYSSLGCMTANDCTVYYEKNQCSIGCGIVMPSAAIGNLDDNLQGYAQQNCSPTCPNTVPPCDAPQPPVCVNNRCE